jgi:hypothetical protein
MRGMFPARIAELLRFQAVRMLFPVLGHGVVPVLAIVALQRNDFAHRVPSTLSNDVTQ